MRIGAWYAQVFSDEVLYFLGTNYLKNGNMAGVLVTEDVLRPRARPKAKQSSVPQTGHYERLWRECLASEVPEEVREAKNHYLGIR